MPYPEFFGHTGTCTETRTLTKVLENALSDRATKVVALIKMLFDAKQLNRVLNWLGKKNGQLLNWLKIKKIVEGFKNCIWVWHWVSKLSFWHKNLQC